jgi:DNA (cytosine-5)-methyltransferase 1
MNLKIIELFAGIGSQHQALKNLNIDHEVVAISEIDKYAVQSYTALHGQPNNLGDITKIQELPKADLWTYSFPCQDISVAGKQAGIKEGTRSGLLYEVERLLTTARDNGTLPKYLLLENVKNLVGRRHKPDFDKWLDFLNGLGYWSYWQVLNAKDYGIPQNRERVFVVSILGGGYYKFPEKQELKLRLKDILEEKVDEKYYLSEKLIKGFLKKEERNPAFKFEPRTENDTAACLTARYYKMGISDNYIAEPQHDAGMQTQNRTRKLTPRECWRLTGWKDTEIDKVIACGMSNSQMYKQAGNGIVVDVLEALFRELFLKETKEHEVNQVNFALTNQIKMEFWG